VSGVNHGSNSSINVIYSGTMSAAVEAVEGIPVSPFEWNADFETMKPFIRNHPRGFRKSF
jgi:5'-nucleotidase